MTDYIGIDPDLEADLRFELKQAGLRWDKKYRTWKECDLRSFMENMRRRRESKAAMEAEMIERRKQPEREDDFQRGVGGSVGTLQHDCGGGYRVIRSTRTFGG